MLRLFAALFLDEVTQLALHRLEGVMHDFRQRLMRPVIHLFLLGHEFVTRRYRDVDTNAERISLFVSMIRLLDRDIAAADVIAELVEPSPESSFPYLNSTIPSELLQSVKTSE